MIPSAGHLFYVEDLAAPQLSESDHHHAVRVLRVRDGEELSVADGHGSWRRCVWEAGRPVPIGSIVVEPPARPEIVIGIALTKGGTVDLAVQKLTEIGVDRIRPFVAERSVLRWEPSRAARALGRWRTIAREAGMQSRRAVLPVVEPVASFADVAVSPAVLCCRDGRPIAPGDVTLLVGPEGGWSTSELSAPLDRVSLGGQVLRAETAAIVAAARAVAHRG